MRTDLTSSKDAMSSTCYSWSVCGANLEQDAMFSIPAFPSFFPAFFDRTRPLPHEFQQRRSNCRSDLCVANQCTLFLFPGGLEHKRLGRARPVWCSAFSSFFELF